MGSFAVHRLGEIPVDTTRTVFKVQGSDRQTPMGSFAVHRSEEIPVDTTRTCTVFKVVFKVQC